MTTQYLHTQTIATRRRCVRNDNQDSPREPKADEAESKVSGAARRGDGGWRKRVGGAAKDQPTEFLDSRDRLLGVLQLVTREGDDACQADMLSSFDLNTTQGQRDAARHRSSSGGLAGAFLTAIPGGRMTLGNDMSVVSLWHRRGPMFPPTWPPPPCKCRAGVAAEADHAMVCEKVAKMTPMRHDNLANALRLVFSACSCHSAVEPRHGVMAGKKGMVKFQRRGDIVAVLPLLELAAKDAVLAHAPAKSHAVQPAKAGGRPRRRACFGLGELRRGLNTPSGRGSGRMCLIKLLSGLCRLRLICADTWVRRR